MHALAVHLPEGLPEHDRECAARLVESILKEGYVITVNDGEDDVLSLSSDPQTILQAMGSTDADHLFARKVVRIGTIERIGRFTLIYGNSPGETIADHTVNDFCERHYNVANEPWDDFVIAGPLDENDQRLYWSNNHGWVERNQATVFAYTERHLRNPMGATGRERD